MSNLRGNHIRILSGAPSIQDCVLCQIMTQKAAAELLKMPRSTLSDLLCRIISRTRESHRIRVLKTLGVDEIDFCKGRKYATVVYDLDRARVVWVGQGK